MMARANEGDAHAYGDDPWTERVTGRALRSVRRPRRLLRVQRDRRQHPGPQPDAAPVRGSDLRGDRPPERGRVRGRRAAAGQQAAHRAYPGRQADPGAGGHPAGRPPRRAPGPAPGGGHHPGRRSWAPAIRSRSCGRSGSSAAATISACTSTVRGWPTRSPTWTAPMADIAAEADVLSFGGTKNGAVAAEAVLVMTGDSWTRCRSSASSSCSWPRRCASWPRSSPALLEDQTWLRNAAHANAMAQRLAEGLRDIPGVSVRHAVAVQRGVRGSSTRASPGRCSATGVFTSGTTERNTVRLMAAFDTTADDVDSFLAAMREASGSRV